VACSIGSGAVASLAPESLRPQVRPRLLALARKELTRPDRAESAGEDAFRFRHLLIRDAAYQDDARAMAASDDFGSLVPSAARLR
jgi:hypothetical protein